MHYLKYNTAFKLEEVFQLLKESLEICPFNQNNCSPTKKHISRLKQLLDPDFSSCLSETSSLFFSSLMAAKTHIDSFELDKSTKLILLKNIYHQLLLTSQLIMSFGIHSERSINSLIKLKQLLHSQTQFDDIDSVIISALKNMQTHIISSISIDSEND